MPTRRRATRARPSCRARTRAVAIDQLRRITMSLGVAVDVLYPPWTCRTRDSASPVPIFRLAERPREQRRDRRTAVVRKEPGPGAAEVRARDDRLGRRSEALSGPAKPAVAILVEHAE